MRLESLLLNYTFHPPTEENIQEIARFHDGKFVRRLILILKYFREYYEEIVGDEKCQILVGVKIIRSLMSKETQSLYPVTENFVQILFDFNIKLPLGDIIDKDVLDHQIIFTICNRLYKFRRGNANTSLL